MMQLIAGQLINGIIVGSLYGIIALAVSLTSGITGVVNFALGAFMLVGAYLTWHLNETYGVAFPFAVILVMGVVALIGLVADVLLFRHTRNNLINGLIVSIGLVSVIVALVHMTWTSTPQNMQPFVTGVFTVGGVVVPKMKLLMGVVLILIVSMTYLGLTRTWMGRAAYAYAQNYRSPPGWRGRLWCGLVRTRWVDVRHALLTDPRHWRAVHAEGRRRGATGRHRQRDRGAVRRHSNRCGRRPGFGVPAACMQRRLWLADAGTSAAFQAGRSVREALMRVLLLVLCGAVALVPALTANNVVLSVLTFTFILGILAVSFNLIYGITGQLTLFHAAAFGVGAYATHLSMAHWSISFWLGSAFAMGCVAVVSLLLGIVCFRFRLKEFYFAVVTLAFAEMIRLVVMNWHGLTNGSLGINFNLKPSVGVPGVGALVIEGPVRWYYFSLACVVVIVLAYQLVVNSWIGNAFKAIRLNEDVAASLGLNAFRYKLLSFVLGSMGASFAGGLYSHYMGFVDPHLLDINQSLAILSMALIGGTGSVAAPVVGALVVTALPHLIDLNAEWRLLIYGLILILTILLMPQGIVGSLQRLRKHA